MASYWYSTDGMDQKRLSDRHLELLDKAFEGKKRVEIHDQQAFGNTAAIADPFLGTMTAGDIHYGLYRNPTLRVMMDEDDTSINSLAMLDSTTLMLDTYHQSTVSNNQHQDDHWVLIASDRHVSPLVGQRRPSAGKAVPQQPTSNTSNPLGSMSRTNNRRDMPPEEECACCIIS
ncbi:hypothetical protein LRAMOSA05845 [Lichtheimia ramosa]|uniref:Uncharacterized protein n=1 Tax=Lichtheimia ramosa TaxID=688394 RepID=A0A077X1E4_9FUNG|nr:hypothetical protein LRAMOSA05845 [Lichtheimia ramosa]